jgi:hypothetical protein
VSRVKGLASCLHVQRLRLRQGVRIRTIAMGLRLAGHGKMADKLLSGWKVTGSTACHGKMRRGLYVLRTAHSQPGMTIRIGVLERACGCNDRKPCNNH